jgi:predicted transcriptional regulator
MLNAHVILNTVLNTGKDMKGNIVKTTKHKPQLQMAPMEYAYETKLVKLRQNDNWNSTLGSKRGRLEIMAEILLYCNQEKGKTKIMYKTNLNYSQLKKYLRALTSKRLLDANADKYFTTRKGRCFLEIFAQLSAMLKSA